MPRPTSRPRRRRRRHLRLPRRARSAADGVPAPPPHHGGGSRARRERSAQSEGGRAPGRIGPGVPAHGAPPGGSRRGNKARRSTTLYEAAGTFDEVYAAIVEELVAAAAARSCRLCGARLAQRGRAHGGAPARRRPGRGHARPRTLVPRPGLGRAGYRPAGPRRPAGRRRRLRAGGAGRGWTLPGRAGLVPSPAVRGEAERGRTEPRTARPGQCCCIIWGWRTSWCSPVDWWELDRTVEPDHLTSVYIPALGERTTAATEMARLDALMDTLREQCPWDQAQTHASLMPHLVEESYEVLDALADLEETGGSAAAYAHLEEELGDLLFQIVFHARLAREEDRFDLAGVARGVHDKLVHRHPHVFGDVEATEAEQVVANWEEIKRQEKGRRSVTEGIPLGSAGPDVDGEAGPQGAFGRPGAAGGGRGGSRGGGPGAVGRSRREGAAPSRRPAVGGRCGSRPRGGRVSLRAGEPGPTSGDRRRARAARAARCASATPSSRRRASPNPTRQTASLFHRCPFREGAEGENS